MGNGSRRRRGEDKPLELRATRNEERMKPDRANSVLFEKKLNVSTGVLRSSFLSYHTQGKQAELVVFIFLLWDIFWWTEVSVIESGGKGREGRDLL